MKGWQIIKPRLIEEREITEPFDPTTSAKVKITKTLVNFADILRFNGDIPVSELVPGSFGIGIISEAGTNLFDLQKGNRVYVEPNKTCNECYNCKNNERMKCSDLQIAGEDFNGFLRDFASADISNLYVLPDSVSDLEALFIEYISLSIAIVDKLGIQKGDHVAIIGANNFGNIFAQLLIYYQAVPILICEDDENAAIARDSGVYYVLSKDDNWQKEVSVITGGRMAKSVVYISDCDLMASKAFALASYNAKIAFTGTSYKNTSVSFAAAIKKQLNILCIDTGFGNTAASINLIANKAVNFSHLKFDSATYESIPKVLSDMSESLKKGEKFYETIVDLV